MFHRRRLKTYTGLRFLLDGLALNNEACQRGAHGLAVFCGRGFGSIERAVRTRRNGDHDDRPGHRFCEGHDSVSIEGSKATRYRLRGPPIMPFWGRRLLSYWFRIGLSSHIASACIDPDGILHDAIHDRIGVDPGTESLVPVLLRVLSTEHRQRPDRSRCETRFRQRLRSPHHRRRTAAGFSGRAQPCPRPS